MKKPTRKELAAWRPISEHEEVRTVWRDGQWMLERRWKGQTLLVEGLGLRRWSGAMRISLAELRAINSGFPLYGIYEDDGWWATHLHCSECEDFPWRLPLRFSDPSGLRLQWEMELARYMAGRTQQSIRSCPSCIEKELQSNPDQTVCWFSVEQQEWCLQVSLAPGESIVLPLGLPSWSSRDRIRSEIDRIMLHSGKPFDWNEEN